MIANRIGSLAVTLASTVIVMLFCALGAYAAAPVKLVLSNHIGWKVEKTTEGKTCAVAPGHECQLATPSSEQGGFENPEGIAGAPNGDVYIADQANNRVQKLTATGEFIMMFGKKVDKSTGANICAKASRDTCGAGEPGGPGEEFQEPQSISIDPVTENVYILDSANSRIVEYTAGGQFILTVGKDVNKTKVMANGDEAERNLCTLASKDVCQAGIRVGAGSTEKGAFKFKQLAGNLLAVGGAPQHLLYVGDEDRVQEFNEKGEWQGQIGLPSTVGPPITSLAVDGATETVYVVSNTGSSIHELDTKGTEIGRIDVPPQEEGKLLQIQAIALDSFGHLVVWVNEGEGFFLVKEMGYLYQISDGRLLTRFTTPEFLNSSNGGFGVGGMGFNGNGELYAAIGQEVWSYDPKPVTEIVTLPASCVPGAERETNATLDCVLNGEVDAWGVTETEAWFQWGRTLALGQDTEPQKIGNVKQLPVEGEEEPFVPVSSVIHGVRPKESSFYYRLVGRDHNVNAPELLIGFPTVSFTTPSVPPKIVGEPKALFIKPSSAVLSGVLNPENTKTEYFFEYGACEELAGCAQKTSTLRSGAYGTITAMLEANGLQPATTYRYRLAATNEKGEAAPITPREEGVFTTSSATKVQAQTGEGSAVGATTATINGTVEPDGQPAVYTFELGVSNGAGTQYGVVFSGPTDASTIPIAESLQLTGLQPATTYAYRIAIHVGQGAISGSLATGAPGIFTTQGTPETLPPPRPLPILGIPPIKFPRAKPTPRTTCKPGHKLDKHHKCVKTKTRKAHKPRTRTKKK